MTFAQAKEELAYQEELEKIFTRVHLVYLPKWKSAINCLSAIWSSLPVQVLYFNSRQMRSKLEEVLATDTFDAVHVQHLRMSPYLSGRKDIPRILDMPDAFSLYWRRRTKAEANPFFKLFGTIEQERVFKGEKIMREYDLSLVCSQEDLDYLRKQHGIDNIRLLPNGVDLDIFSPQEHDYSHSHTLLFTGNMDYAPNVDAVVYFAGEIFPSIKAKFPHVKFMIAGQRPVKKVQDLAGEDIIVTGFVKDLAAVYNSASIVVAPLRFGAGTQNKVLEGMAMGIPVVCSNVGFKGLNINSGEGAIMKITSNEFAESVIQLLGSAALREQVGKKGVEVIKSRFGWDAIAAKLETYFSEISRH